MRPQAALLLAKGFEEAEVVIVLDVLRRLNIDVTLLSCENELQITSYHGLQVQADAAFADRYDQLFDAVILPGGPEGATRLGASAQVAEFVARHDQAGRWICALCSAAARVLAANKLLRGREYVCSGDLWQLHQDGRYVDQTVVIDGNLITGKGLGRAFDFAFVIAGKLLGDMEPSIEHADHIYYPFHGI